MPLATRTRQEGQIQLSDGRHLGYDEFGAPDGMPVLYCHGLPASRLEARLTHDVALHLGVRVVAPDRPGFGRSDFLPGRTLAAWPEDVAQLAARLRLARFAVLGVSGGGPYAIACACRLQQQLTAVGLVAPLGPVALPGLDRIMKWPARFSFHLARNHPRLARLVYAEGLGRLLKHHPRLTLLLLQTAEPDRRVLRRPEIAEILEESIREAFRRNGRGAVEELRLLGSEWHLDLRRIRTPVYLWHGELDRTVPAIMGRHLAAAIPGCRQRFYPEEGHFSLPVEHMREILQSLTAP